MTLDIVNDKFVHADNVGKVFDYLWSHSDVAQVLQDLGLPAINPHLVAQAWSTHPDIKEVFTPQLTPYVNAEQLVPIDGFIDAMFATGDAVANGSRHGQILTFFDRAQWDPIKTTFKQVLSQEDAPSFTGLQYLVGRLQGMAPGTRAEQTLMDQLGNVNGLKEQIVALEAKVAGAGREQEALEGQYHEQLAEGLAERDEEVRTAQEEAGRLDLDNKALRNQIETKNTCVGELEKDLGELTAKLSEGGYDIQVTDEHRLTLGLLTLSERYSPNRVLTIDVHDFPLDWNNVAAGVKGGTTGLSSYLPEGTYADQFFPKFEEAKASGHPQEFTLTDTDGREYPCAIMPRTSIDGSVSVHGTFVVHIGDEEAVAVTDAQTIATRKAQETPILAERLGYLARHYRATAERTVEGEALEEKLSAMEIIVDLWKGNVADANAAKGTAELALRSSRDTWALERKGLNESHQEDADQLNITIEDLKRSQRVLTGDEGPLYAEQLLEILAPFAQQDGYEHADQLPPLTTFLQNLLKGRVTSTTIEAQHMTDPSNSGNSAGDSRDSRPTQLVPPPPSADGNQSHGVLYGLLAVGAGLATLVGIGYAHRSSVESDLDSRAQEAQIENNKRQGAIDFVSEFVDNPQLRARLRQQNLSNALNRLNTNVLKSIDQYAQNNNIGEIAYGQLQDDLVAKGFSPENIFVYVHGALPNKEAQSAFLKLQPHARRQVNINLNYNDE